MSIVYTTTNDLSRGVIHTYHQSPAPRKLNIVDRWSNDDVRGISEGKAFTYLSSLISMYGIGFEVEKNTFNGLQTEHALFKGYEYDGSCGVEAITNVLPLLPRSIWRMKVYNMMHVADTILSDVSSPSDSRCGGHMHLSVHAMRGEDLLSKIRKYSGVMYALYRHRLSNQYCRFDLFMDGRDNPKGLHTHNDYKYRVCKITDVGVEFRLPSRVTSSRALMRRYELGYLMVDAAVTNMPMAQFYREASIIVKAMYDGNTEKAKEIMVLAKWMQKMIDERKVNKVTVRFVENHRGYGLRGRLSSLYDRGCHQYMRSEYGEYND